MESYENKKEKYICPECGGIIYKDEECNCKKESCSCGGSCSC
jgi:hypothetical protein